MKCNVNNCCLARLAAVLVVSMVLIPNAPAQRVLGLRDVQEETRRTQYQEKLQQVINDMAGYAATVVQRWEADARASGKWDENYSTDLQNALMKLPPDNLLAAGEASSYEAMLRVLATGRPVPAILPDHQGTTMLPRALGDVTDDLVYSPVTPCRIVDTRNAGGPIGNHTTRSFDVDGSNFSPQGGNAGPCGIPYGVARAVVMNITVTQPSAPGYLTAWGLGATQPLASTLNFVGGDTLANTTIVPVLPGTGNDFNIYAGGATAHVVIDVLGYYAAPVATALDCITVTSAPTACAYNAWTAVDAVCPAGRTATGGGYDTTEGSLGYPGVWLTTIPNGNGWRTWVDNQNSGSRNIRTFVNCCRVPGR